MPDLTFTLTNEQMVKMQIAVYVTRPQLWAVDEAIILNENTNAVLAAGDGTGANMLAATDGQINALINNGKVASDAQIKQVGRQNYIALLDAATERIKQARAAASSNLLGDSLA